MGYKLGNEWPRLDKNVNKAIPPEMWSSMVWLFRKKCPPESTHGKVPKSKMADEAKMADW